MAPTELIVSVHTFIAALHHLLVNTKIYIYGYMDVQTITKYLQ